MTGHTDRTHLRALGEIPIGRGRPVKAARHGYSIP
jgi:hypothetical protein